MTPTPPERNSRSASSDLMKVGAVLVGLGVAAGAFGAHALRDHLTPASLELFRTAALYQLLHGIAIVAIAGGMSHFDKVRLGLACWLMALGTLLFSGSLYVLAATGLRLAGYLTPVGGLLLLLAWGFVFAGARKLPRGNSPH